MKELVASTKSLIECQENFDVGCNDGRLLDFSEMKEQKHLGWNLLMLSWMPRKKHVTYKEYLTPDVSKKIINENGKWTLFHLQMYLHT